MKTTEQRFWEKVEIIPFHSCWEWVGAKNWGGYGLLWGGLSKPRTLLAHRFSYEIHKGHIDAGLDMMHSCDNPGCVNPDHLTPGTTLDNILDCKSKGRMTHPFDNRVTCLTGGHVLRPETIYTHQKSGKKSCIECRRIRDREDKRRGRLKKRMAKESRSTGFFCASSDSTLAPDPTG